MTILTWIVRVIITGLTCLIVISLTEVYDTYQHDSYEAQLYEEYLDEFPYAENGTFNI